MSHFRYDRSFSGRKASREDIHVERRVPRRKECEERLKELKALQPEDPGVARSERELRLRRFNGLDQVPAGSSVGAGSQRDQGVVKQRVQCK